MAPIYADQMIKGTWECYESLTCHPGNNVRNCTNRVLDFNAGSVISRGCDRWSRYAGTALWKSTGLLCSYVLIVLSFCESFVGTHFTISNSWPARVTPRACHLPGDNNILSLCSLGLGWMHCFCHYSYINVETVRIWVHIRVRPWMWIQICVLKWLWCST